jgi:hypothetical protein
MEAIAVGSAVCFLLGVVVIQFGLALGRRAFERRDGFEITIRAWPPSLHFKTDGRGRSDTQTPGIEDGQSQRAQTPMPEDVNDLSRRRTDRGLQDDVHALRQKRDLVD